MKRSRATLALTLAATLCLHAGSEEDFCSCGRLHALADPTSPTSQRQRHYAPDRDVDILHLAIDLTPDFALHRFAGTVTLRFKPISRPLRELRLDQEDLTIDAVESTQTLQAYQVTREQLIITFANPIPPGEERQVSVRYHADDIIKQDPVFGGIRRGLTFCTPRNGFPATDTHLWTHGEPIFAREWFPSFDSPNEKFTSEVTCRVPEGMVVLSNGRKTAEVKDPASGLVAITWLQDKPHVNYLITLVAGHLHGIHDRHKDLPLGFWTPPSMTNEAPRSFRDTRKIMAFFEQEIGVPYPWARYDQVVVGSESGFGMEHTAQTTLGAGSLSTDSFETLRNPESLNAHELAHQWFGDLVTCKDWTHLWLNEGFATYYDALWVGHRYGPADRDYHLLQNARRVLPQVSDTTPIADRQFSHPRDQFSFRAYPKGAWVLHMLRHQLGDDLFRRCVKTYLERHQYDTVVTEDLNAVIEELSGRSFDRFFDQWIYHAGVPELKIDFSWDEPTRLARLSIRQTQKLSDDVLLFDLPLPVRFRTPQGNVDQTLRVHQPAEDFFVPLPQAPTEVRIDPAFSVLARIQFDPPRAMIHAQATNATDAIGRILALEALATRTDPATTRLLRHTLTTDPFYGARIEASRSLQKHRNDDAFAALVAGLPQPDARVRLQVVRDLATFYRPETAAHLREVIAREKNPDLIAAAIAGLAAHPDTDSTQLLAAQLQRPSFRHVLANAALTALRSQEAVSALPAIFTTVRAMETSFPFGPYTNGLHSLARLSRHQADPAEVREYLLARLQDPRTEVRIGAIHALGQLRDPRALPALDTFTSLPAYRPERPAALSATALLRELKPVAPELGEVRSQVLELQKQNRELHDQLDQLRKRVDAQLPPATTPSKSKTKPRK